MSRSRPEMSKVSLLTMSAIRHSFFSLATLFSNSKIFYLKIFKKPTKDSSDLVRNKNGEIDERRGEGQCVISLNYNTKYARMTATLYYIPRWTYISRNTSTIELCAEMYVNKV